MAELGFFGRAAATPSGRAVSLRTSPGDGRAAGGACQPGLARPPGARPRAGRHGCRRGPERDRDDGCSSRRSTDRAVHDADQPSPGRSRDRIHRPRTARPRRWSVTSGSLVRSQLPRRRRTSPRIVGSRSGRSPGGARTRTSPTGSPTRVPDNRTAGAPMHYTSGTTGQPKGVKRALADDRPGQLGALYSLVLDAVRGASGRRQRAPARLAALSHCGAASRRSHCPRSATRSCSWTWSTRDDARLIERHRVTHTHMVPTQFHRLLALPDGFATSTTVVAAVHDPRGGAVPARGQAPDDLVGR